MLFKAKEDKLDLIILNSILFQTKYLQAINSSSNQTKTNCNKFLIQCNNNKEGLIILNSMTRSIKDKCSSNNNNKLLISKEIILNSNKDNFSSNLCRWGNNSSQNSFHNKVKICSLNNKVNYLSSKDKSISSNKFPSNKIIPMLVFTLVSLDHNYKGIRNEEFFMLCCQDNNKYLKTQSRNLIKEIIEGGVFSLI